MSNERPRGFLSKRDRKYLKGESDIEPKSPQERNVRRAIRQRTRSAFYDFSIVLEELRETDREQIFDVEEEQEERFEDALADNLTFVCLGVTDELQLGAPGYGRTGLTARGSRHAVEFEWIFWRTLERAYREFDVILEELVIETEDIRVPGIDSVIRRLEEGEEIGPETAALLIRAGKLDPKSVTELAREELLEGEDR